MREARHLKEIQTSTPERRERWALNNKLYAISSDARIVEELQWQIERRVRRAREANTAWRRYRALFESVK